MGTKTGNQHSTGENMDHICITVYQDPVKVFIFYNAILELFIPVWSRTRKHSNGRGIFMQIWRDSVVKLLQFSSVAQLCPTLCDPMNRSTPGHPVHHQLREFTQTHVHRVCDAIQPSHPLLSPFSPAPNPSQHQSLFQWVNTSHEVAKVLEFQIT